MKFSIEWCGILSTIVRCPSNNCTDFLAWTGLSFQKKIIFFPETCQSARGLWSICDLRFDVSVSLLTSFSFFLENCSDTWYCNNALLLFSFLDRKWRFFGFSTVSLWLLFWGFCLTTDCLWVLSWDFSDTCCYSVALLLFSCLDKKRKISGSQQSYQL